MNGAKTWINQKIITRECSLITDQKLAYLDYRRADDKGLQDSGMLGCWCSRNTNVWNFPDIYSRTHEKVQKQLKAEGKLPADDKPDTRKYCA